MYYYMVLSFLGFWFLGFLTTDKRGHFEVSIPEWLSRILFLKIKERVMIQTLILQIWIYLVTATIFIGWYIGLIDDVLLHSNIVFWTFVVYFIFAAPDIIIYDRKKHQD